MHPLLSYAKGNNSRFLRRSGPSSSSSSWWIESFFDSLDQSTSPPLGELFSFDDFPATNYVSISRLSVQGIRASQQYASFPSFSWRLRSSNFPLPPRRNANRFSPFEARLVLRKTIYDPNIVQRLALQTKRTKNLGSIEIIPDYLRIICVLFSWMKVGEESRKERDIEIVV